MRLANLVLFLSAGLLATCGGGSDGSAALEGAAALLPQAAPEEAAAAAPGPSKGWSARPQVRVNDFTAGYQDLVSAGPLSDGGYAVVWNSSTTEPVRDGIDFYLQRYDAAGRKVGRDIRLYHAAFEQFTQPAVLASGDVLVASLAVRGDGSSSIHLERFDRHGALTQPRTEAVARAATPDGFRLQSPLVTALADGGFVLSYSEGPPLSGAAVVFVQRFAAGGSPRHDLVRIEGTRPDARVQADGEGGFFLSTTVFDPASATGCFGATSEPRTLSIRHYGAGSAPARTVLAPGAQKCAEVLRLEGDRFMLLGDITTLPFSQLLDGAGVPLGERTPIAVPPAQFSRPSLTGKAVLADGSYVLLWRSAKGLEIQHYEATGGLAAAPFTIAAPGAGMRLVALPAGGLSITASATDRRDDLDVYTQLFKPDKQGKACGVRGPLPSVPC